MEERKVANPVGNSPIVETSAKLTGLCLMVISTSEDPRAEGFTGRLTAKMFRSFTIFG